MTSALDWLSICPTLDFDAQCEPRLPPPPDAIESVGGATLSRYDLLATPVWIYDFRAERIRWANRAGVGFWQERNLDDLSHRPLAGSEVFGDKLATYRRKLESGHVIDGVWTTTVQGYEVIALCRLVPIRIDGGAIQALVEASAWQRSSDDPGPAPADTQSHHGRLNLLLEGQSAILQLIAKGAPLEVTLERIALFVARIFDPKLCVVQWLENDGMSCRHVAAPVILDDALRRWPPLPSDAGGFDPASAAPTVEIDRGAQSSAIARTARTVAGLEAVCRALGLAVSWSTVVRGEAGPLGTLALLESEPAPVDEDEQRVLSAMVQLACFAMENDRHKLALRSANERLLSLASMIPGVVYQRVVRPDGDIRYTYISDGAQDLFGVSPDEILANPQALFDRHGPAYYKTFRDRLMAASRTLDIWDVEAEIVTRDGERKYTHAIARPHRQTDGSVVWNGVILDQTRIKEAEMAAAAAEAGTRDAIINSVPQGLALFDADDRLVTWNSQFLSLYPALEELMAHGLSYADLLRAEIERGIDSHDADEDRDEVDPETRMAERVARHGAEDQVTERRLADGRWVLVNEHRTADGGTVILHTDVTELKDREMALTRSNRELEAFATIASHDLQEPLRKIAAFGDRLKSKYHEVLGEEGKIYLERMESATQRMRGLINDLLDYSRVRAEVVPSTVVDLSEVAAAVINDLQTTIEALDAKVEVGRLPKIEADPFHMRQLLQNLISNGLKFHQRDVPPKVKVTGRTIRGKGRDKVKSGTCVIEVADAGIGFDTKYLDRVFTIFQRLHASEGYEGTGIGLATCRKIVEGHGGTITAKSSPGAGATFIVTLPTRRASANKSA